MRYMQKLHAEMGVIEPLAGMESADQDRAEARAIAESEELTAELLKPKADISRKSGKLERESPLFWGTGDSPTLF